MPRAVVGPDPRTGSRALFAFAGGWGHLTPLLPLAEALRAAGWRVAFAGEEVVARRAEKWGEVFGFPSSRGGADRGTGVLVAPDLTHELEVIGRHFVGTLGPQNAHRIADVIESWRPDVIVCDEMDFGAMVASESAGLPLVIVNVIASGALVRSEFVGEALAELRTSAGLGPDPSMSMLEGDLVVSPFPPSFRDPGFPLPPNSLSVRPPSPTRQEITNRAVRWLAEAPPLARVYFTLGTEFNTESGDLFERVLSGVRMLPGARTLVTVGADIDPAAIGMDSPGVRIERFVPQDAVLEVADLSINHGGSGSVIGAVTRGVPVVVLPLGADQELNADRVAALELGTVVDAMTVTGDGVATTATEVLNSVPMRRAVARIAEESASLPGIDKAVEAIERLVRS